MYKENSTSMWESGWCSGLKKSFWWNFVRGLFSRVFKVQSYFFLLSLHFYIVGPRSLEFLKKSGISQTTFFIKVKETSIRSENFILHSLVYKSAYFRKKYFKPKKNFFLTMVDLYTKMCGIKF